MPPLTGVAVKFTVVPIHMVPAGLAAIDTDGLTIGFTCMAVAVAVAIAGDGHTALEVIITDTISPFDKEDDE